MKRNISINISGIIFYIEEDCYDKLHTYLTSINQYFSKYEDSWEILEDIEGRIAEIFCTKLDKHKQVIVMRDVDELMQVMGSVDDFQLAEEDPAFQMTYGEKAFEIPTEDDFGQSGRAVVHVSPQKLIQQEIFLEEVSKKHPNKKELIYAFGKEESQQEDTPFEELQKRLYRDTKRKVLGGVAAGMAHFLNIDPIWIRLLFVLLQTGFLFIPAAPWSAALLYHILWATLPKNDHLEENPQLKKLFRDPEKGVMGGVSAGLAAYLGVNEMLVRVVFISITVLYGTGIFLYIILWILIPEAKTLTEKMQMEGQPINLSNIRDYITENLNFKPHVELSALHRIIIFPFHIIAMLHQRIAIFLRPFVSFAGESIRIGGGLMLLFISLAFSVALVAAVFVFLGWGVEEALTFEGIPTEVLLNSFPFNFWMIAGAFITAFIPTFFIGLFGVMMLRKQIIWNAPLGWSVLALWFFSLIGTGVSIAMIARDFQTGEIFTQKQKFELPEDMFVLDLQKSGEYKQPWITLEAYEGSELVLVKEFIGRGKNRKNAIENAQMISYQMTQDGNILKFGERIDFKKGAKFRNQELRLTLKIPYEQPFKVTQHFAEVFGFEEDVQDEDIWKYSQEEGLVCIGCDPNRKHQDHEESFALQDNGEKADYEDFNEISAAGALTLKIHQGDSYSVNLIGDPEAIKSVKIEQHGDRLEFGLKNWDNHSEHPIIVEIVMPDLEGMELSGACLGEVEGFQQDEIELSLSGASRLNIRGETKRLDAELSGACTLNAHDFKSQEVGIDASGACQVQVWAERKIHIEASGASHIKYRGNPKNVQVENSGMSSISKI
ncbi:MAG: PspC domain-containing protein [Microscillaceae bacterium]|nr:PspC domain-containing protein [Microscillaceae bacterium]